MTQGVLGSSIFIVLSLASSFTARFSSSQTTPPFFCPEVFLRIPRGLTLLLLELERMGGGGASSIVAGTSCDARGDESRDEASDPVTVKVG